MVKAGSSLMRSPLTVVMVCPAAWVANRVPVIIQVWWQKLGAFSGGTIPVDDDTRIEMGAAARIEDSPAPSDTSGTRILPYLYTVFMLLFHGRYMTRAGWRNKDSHCHVPVI